MVELRKTSTRNIFNMTVERKTWLRKDPEYKAVAPEEIEIFPGLELQKPKIKKTPKMLEVEKLVGDDLGKFLDRKYSIEELSLNSIRAEIRNMSEGKTTVGFMTLRNWLRVYGIQLKSQLEALRLVWKNPKKREAMIAKTHTPEANKKRASAISAYWQSLPEKEKQERLRLLKKGYIWGKANMREILLKKIQETLGGSPEEILRRMYWDEGLSANEIGKKINKNSSTIILWMKRLGIERREKGGPGTIRSNRGGKRSIVQQAEDQGLLEILTSKELAVIRARYPPNGNGVKSFSAILKEGLYPNSQATSRQALQDAEKRAIQKLARALIKDEPF